MNSDSNALGDMLGSVLSNPEALGNLMRVASSLGLGNLAGGGGTDGTASQQSENRENSSPMPGQNAYGDAPSDNIFPGGLQTEQSPQSSPFSSSPSLSPSPSPERKKAGDNEDRIRLLNALRPYLGDDRRKSMDSVLGIMKLMRLAEESGLLRDGLNLGTLFSGGKK